MFTVIAEFYDLQDNKHRYIVGDKFPHDGLIVTEERLKYLASDANKNGYPVIKEIKEKSRKRKADDARTSS